MNEVLTQLGGEPQWGDRGVVTNNAAVDITKSVLANSEDGHLYRWDLTTNTLPRYSALTAGLGRGLHTDGHRAGRHGLRHQ